MNWFGRLVTMLLLVGSIALALGCGARKIVDEDGSLKTDDPSSSSDSPQPLHFNMSFENAERLYRMTPLYAFTPADRSELTIDTNDTSNAYGIRIHLVEASVGQGVTAGIYNCADASRNRVLFKLVSNGVEPFVFSNGNDCHIRVDEISPTRLRGGLDAYVDSNRTAMTRVRGEFELELRSK